MARDFREGRITFADFADAFAESRDDLIADLYDLLEHAPQRGGVLGVSEKTYAQYQADLERAILALDDDPSQAGQ